MSAWLKEADALFQQGTWSLPAKKNALDRYRQVLAAEPGNAAAKAGIFAVVDGYMRRAEEQLAKGDRDGARWRYQRAIDILNGDGMKLDPQGAQQKAQAAEQALERL